MQFKRLNEREVTAIYNTYMLNDFPKSELKPLELLVGLIKSGCYFGCGLYEQGKLKAYALFAESYCKKYLILDYFAVVKEFRGKGYGSFMLEKMRSELLAEYKTILAEVENPDYSLNESDKQMRCRRIAFYRKNHAVMSDIKAKVNTDRYLIIYFGDEMTGEQIKKRLASFYKMLFGDLFEKTEIQII